MNDLPCDKCRHFDQMHRFKGDVKQPLQYGWCVARSRYPHKEADAQVFPDGAQRVGPGERAEPFIVWVSQIVRECNQVSPK